MKGFLTAVILTISFATPAFAEPVLQLSPQGCQFIAEVIADAPEVKIAGADKAQYIGMVEEFVGVPLELQEPFGKFLDNRLSKVFDGSPENAKKVSEDFAAVCAAKNGDVTEFVGVDI